jgi:superoxide dismutase
MGNVAGFGPVLVMDVWQHELLLDYQPAHGRNTSKPFSQTLTGRQANAGFNRDIKKP